MADVANIESVKKETVDLIVAEICAATQSTDIKNCVQCYEYGKSVVQIKQDLMKYRKPQLIATFEFLKWQHESMPRLKPNIVNDIVCRIQNFLPETCDICKETYRTKFGDMHFLACAICGQEAHVPCILAKLRLDATDRPSHKEVQEMLNPYGLKNLQYVCNPCGETTIPGYCLDENDTTTVTETLPIVEPVQYSKPLSPSPSINRPKAVLKDSKVEATCKFYNQGTCKHGKQGVNCKYSHPPLCKKLLQHGNNADRGCRLKGDECDNHHPIMCKNSLNRGFCFKKVCNKYHVQGTKRVPNQKQDRNHMYNINSNKNNSQGHKNLGGHSDQSHSDTRSDFLDLLKKMKEDIVKEMESRLSNLRLPPSLPVAPPYYFQPHHLAQPRQPPAMQRMLVPYPQAVQGAGAPNLH